MNDNSQTLDCVEGGSGTCRNYDLIAQLRAELAIARACIAELEPDALQFRNNNETLMKLLEEWVNDDC